MNDFKVKDLRTRLRRNKATTTILKKNKEDNNTKVSTTMRNLCYIYVNKNARSARKKKTQRERAPAC